MVMSDYRKYKMRVMKEFGVEITEELQNKIATAKTKIQADQIARTAILKTLYNE